MDKIRKRILEIIQDKDHFPDVEKAADRLPPAGTLPNGRKT